MSRDALLEKTVSMTHLSPKKRRQRLLQYLLSVLVLAAVIDIPVFWELDIYYSESKPSVAHMFPSALRRNKFYSLFYVGCFRLLVLGVIPFASLLILNYKIAKDYKRNAFVFNIRREANGITPKRLALESKMTKTLIAIVVTFLVCHLPRVSLNCMEFYILDNLNTLKALPSFMIPIKICNSVFLILNSSVNVIFYVYFYLFKKKTQDFDFTVTNAITNVVMHHASLIPVDHIMSGGTERLI